MSLKTIRSYCVHWCMRGQAREVVLCTSPECALFPLRLGKGVGAGDGASRSAIRARCLDCSGTAPAVRECPFTDCQLWAHRSGKRQPRVSREVASAGSAMRGEAVSTAAEAEEATGYHPARSGLETALSRPGEEKEEPEE